MATNKNKHYQRGKKKNPELAKINFRAEMGKALADAEFKGINFACGAYEVIALNILNDKFGMDDEDLERFVKETKEFSKMMNGGWASLDEFIKTLKDEHPGFKLSIDDIYRIDPDMVADSNE